MNFWVIIPARYASTRLPGKPLCEIAGKPMLWYVYQHALNSGAEKVVIATDDTRIQTVMAGYGADICMTAANHSSGTDRVAEVVERYHPPADTVIVNVQGDEPLLPSLLIRQVAEALASQAQADMSTLCEPIETVEPLFNPHIVKVVRDQQGFALYFSRAPIPWQRDNFGQPHPTLTPAVHFRHIGIYAYRPLYLLQYTRLPRCALETEEALEQLRVLFTGGRIYVVQAAVASGVGVDTAADLEKVRQLVKESGGYLHD